MVIGECPNQPWVHQPVYNIGVDYERDCFNIEMLQSEGFDFVYNFLRPSVIGFSDHCIIYFERFLFCSSRNYFGFVTVDVCAKGFELLVNVLSSGLPFLVIGVYECNVICKLVYI